jgi:hypothetical protein
VAVHGQDEELEERISQEQSPTVEGSVIIDLETVMDPPERLPIVMTWNLKDNPTKSSPYSKEEDSSEFDIFQRIRFGLINNGIFEVECPVGSGVIKKISGRQLHGAYKEW